MTIRPSSELRNNYKDIARICKEKREPVYLTVNGKGDTALIDIEVLNELYERLALYQNIAMGLKDVSDGKVISHDDLRKKFGV